MLSTVARAALEDALVEGDERAAQAAARVLLHDSFDLPELYSDVVAPVLDLVGERWASGQIGVADEHATSSAVRGLVSGLRAGLDARWHPQGRVVLLPLEREHHVVGLWMLEHVLLAEGWQVSLLDAMPAAEVVRFLQRVGDVVALGVSCHDVAEVGRLARTVREVRTGVPGLPVVVGGLAVRSEPGLAARVGAEGSASSLRAAVDLLRRLTNPLTERENEVLTGVADGLTNAEIAERLGVAASTVKTHLERIYLKTGHRDRAAAVAVGFRRGWLS